MMLRRYSMVREVARHISDAADGAFRAYPEGRVREEPQITNHILGAIEERFRTLRSYGSIWRAAGRYWRDMSTETWNFDDVDWKPSTLRTGRGEAAEEKRHGADLMGVLDIDLLGYKVKKGFLAQAKKAEPRRRFTTQKWKTLVSQCDKMLQRTPDSFVFIYSKREGIRIFPAVSVFGSDSKDIFDLYHHSIQNFFENHIECFIGDPRLNSPDINTLDALADFPVERILYLTARMPE